MRETAAAALIAAIISGPAFGQACAPRDLQIERLLEQYGETRQAAGTSAGKLVEMWANLESGSWTFTATNPAGIMCMLASGQNYEPIKAEPVGLKV